MYRHSLAIVRWPWKTKSLHTFIWIIDTTYGEISQNTVFCMFVSLFIQVQTLHENTGIVFIRTWMWNLSVIFNCGNNIMILRSNIELYMYSASRFLFQNTLPAYYFMHSIHFLMHLSTLPVLIKSSLHSDVFANFGWWIHHCLFIKADWKQGIHYVVPDNLFTSLSRGTCCSCILLSSSFYKHCVLPRLIGLSSVIYACSHQILVISALLQNACLINRKLCFQENLHLRHFSNRSLIHRYAIWVNEQVGRYSYSVLHSLLQSASLMNCFTFAGLLRSTLKTFPILHITVNPIVENKFPHTVHEHFKKREMLILKQTFELTVISESVLKRHGKEIIELWFS